MSALVLPIPPPGQSLLERISRRVVPAWALRPRMELRIDVRPDPEDIEAELEALFRRLSTPGDALHGLSSLSIPLRGFVFRHREADGEHYVYVEDVARRRLAGYTVFNRLIEVDRRTDRHVRAPHSKYAPAYQRRGIAGAVYRWGLASGWCLVSGARQSPGAHALWRSLGRRHPCGYVALRDRKLRFLGQEISEALRDDLHTRMILLGAGWTFETLRERCSGRRA